MLLGPALGLSAILFSLGVAGVLLRRNAIVLFMCVELMLNAVNLTFVALAQLYGASGQHHGLLRHDRGGGGGGGGAGHHPRDLPAQADRSTSRTSTCCRADELHSRGLAGGRPAAGRVPGRTARWRSGGPQAKGAGLRRGAGRAARRPSRSRSASSSSCWRQPPARADHRPALALAARSDRLQIDLAFQVDQLSVVMLLVVTGVGQPDPPVQRRLHAGGPGVRPLLRVPQPLHRLHAGAGARGRASR